MESIHEALGLLNNYLVAGLTIHFWFKETRKVDLAEVSWVSCESYEITGFLLKSRQPCTLSLHRSAYTAQPTPLSLHRSAYTAQCRKRMCRRLNKLFARNCLPSSTDAEVSLMCLRSVLFISSVSICSTSVVKNGVLQSFSE